MAVKASMGSFLIVEAQPGRERRTTLGGAGVWDGVGPFPQQGLDHALDFAVGLRAIGSGVFGLDCRASGKPCGRGAIDARVVGQHAFDTNPALAEVAQGAQPEGGSGIALLVGQDLDVGVAGAVVNSSLACLTRVEDCLRRHCVLDSECKNYIEVPRTSVYPNDARAVAFSKNPASCPAGQTLCLPASRRLALAPRIALELDRIRKFS